MRCAEEPATRWEGAYELALHVETPTSDDEEEAEAAPSPAEQQAEPQSPPAAGGDAPRIEELPLQGRTEENRLINLTLFRVEVNSTADDPDFAALLTAAQKERLSNVLFNSEKLGESEMTLLPLVATWKDARLVPFLLKQLQGWADDPPYEAETVMMIAARALEDRGLVKFAADYVSDATYEDSYATDEPGPGADEETKRDAEEGRVKAADARTNRSAKVYQFLVLAQQPQKPAGRAN